MGRCRVGNIHCQMITNIHGTRIGSIPMSGQQVENTKLMYDFVHEANMELDRLAKLACETEYEK